MISRSRAIGSFMEPDMLHLDIGQAGRTQNLDRAPASRFDARRGMRLGA
jgi:hypothetical protein